MTLKYVCRRMALLLLATSIVGCSTTSRQSWWECALAGAAVGGVGGAMSDKEAATWGAVGGALIGGLICAVSDNEVSDYDRDGVADVRDRCNDTPAGVPVDQYGCPITKDADMDGVPDKRDRCLNTPLGVPVDAYGCAVPPRRVLQGVAFKLNSSELTESAKMLLNQEVVYLKKYPDTDYQLIGYTDSTGAEDYNDQLSKQRAESVKHYMVNNGVKSTRLTTVGMGSKDPRADNHVHEGRIENRRVEMKLITH